jgi:hypothetical protein
VDESEGGALVRTLKLTEEAPALALELGVPVSSEVPVRGARNDVHA